MVRGRRGAVVPAVVLVAVLAGCVPPFGSVDDETLFEQMRAVPGVESVEVEFQQDPTYGPHYDGEIALEPGLTEDERRCALRSISELFWQGRDTQTDGVSVSWDGESALLTVSDGLAERFGPRPSEPRASATLTPCPYLTATP
ncbi:hypothetical protein GC089_02895 [Cellulomonas sp. JZ18]|uniref:hypothetical protein n=1 Tax=Cellulomonas sp. JZ18 TaxID=2654191 RepID=UPI0012D49B6F|nr:hypothetical protein [Cellulomonas sp. JZ18]QGQ18394.1 hypothetical protein GC089_02895 [Cellulomonas sp. JZ18]